MILLTEKQRLDAIRACDGIERAVANQQKAFRNIVKIFDNAAKGKDPADGLER